MRRAIRRWMRSLHSCGRACRPESYAAARFVRTVPMPGAATAVDLAVKAVEKLPPAREYARRHLRSAESHAGLGRIGRALPRAVRNHCRRVPAFGVPPERLQRCNQGISLDRFAGQRRSSSDLLRIAFAGGLIPSKAPHVLLDAVNILPPESIVIDLLGAAGAYHGRQHYADALAAAWPSSDSPPRARAA